MTTEEKLTLGNRGRQPKRSFMKGVEIRRIRVNALRVTQHALAQQLISPDTGMPISDDLVGSWERGTRAVPLWAARQIREFGEVAALHDKRKPEEEE